MSPVQTLITLRRRRGVVKHSVTCLSTNLKGLEATPELLRFPIRAKHVLSKLDGLDKQMLKSWSTFSMPSRPGLLRVLLKVSHTQGISTLKQSAA